MTDDNVTRLPGSSLSAKELIDQLAADPRITEIIAFVTRVDGGTQLVYTSCTPPDLAMAGLVLNDAALRAARGEDEDREATKARARPAFTTEAMRATLDADSAMMMGGAVAEPPPPTAGDTAKLANAGSTLTPPATSNVVRFRDDQNL